MTIDHIIKRICNLRIKEVILIGDSTTLIDYKYQYIRSLHVADGISQTRVSSHYYIHKVLEYSLFSILGC